MSDVRVPPNNVAAEEAVLGAILLAKELPVEIAAKVEEADFWRPAYRTIWRAINHLADAGDLVTPITVLGRLQATGELADVGGAPAIHDLLAAAGTTAEAKRYAKMVASTAKVRRLIDAGARIYQLGYDLAADPGRALAEAERILVQVHDAGAGALTGKLMGQLLSADELASRPPPSWAIDDVIPAVGTVVLYGRPGSGKSFVALDWATCTALGLPWQGRFVRQGTVLYIAAEGGTGLGLRIRAWKAAFKADAIPGFSVYPGAINLLDAERRGALIELVRQLKPAMLVVDTMARSMAGGNENNPQDVGLVIDALDACRSAVPELVCLVVHHTTKDGTAYRGHSALEGAAETMIECIDDDGTMMLKCEKQKDAAEFDAIRVRRVVVELGAGLSSCVLRAPSSENLTENLAESRRQLIGEFSQHFSETGAPRAQLRLVSKLADATFYRAVNDLVKVGALVNAGTDKVPFYKLGVSL